MNASLPWTSLVSEELTMRHACDIVDADAFSVLSLSLIEQMLDHLPRAPFFIKDSALRYVSANQSMLDLCGVQSN